MRPPSRPGSALAACAALSILAACPSVRAEPAPAAPAAPATATPRVLTLPEALAYARAHQPAIRAAIARVTAQGEEAKVPRAQWLPSVGVTAQIFAATANNTTGTYVGAPYMDVPRIGGSKFSASGGSMQPFASTFVGAGVQQEIFDFGRIAAQSAAADALITIARQRAATERLDVDFAVEEAYFAVYAARSVVRAAEEAFERSRAHRDLANAGVRAGLRSPVELTRAEADLSRFDVGRVRARAGLTVAQAVLAAAVGIPDGLVDVSTAAPAVADMPSLAEATRQAGARDPRVLEAEARVHAQEQTTKAVGAELRPNLSLTSTISVRAGGAPASSGDEAAQKGWLPSVPNWDIGVALSWPIFGGVVNARERASRSLEQVHREELGYVRFAQRVAIQRAFTDVEIARSAIPALQRSFDAALANYAQVDARFKSGMASGIELADAEALRTQAEIDLALGAFDVARSRVAFGRTIAEEP